MARYFFIFQSYSKSKMTSNFTVIFFVDVDVISFLYAVVLSNDKNHDSTKIGNTSLSSFVAEKKILKDA